MRVARGGVGRRGEGFKSSKPPGSGGGVALVEALASAAARGRATSGASVGGKAAESASPHSSLSKFTL